LVWQRDSLKPPTAVVEATKAYLASEDALGGWIEDCCEVGDDKFESASLLFTSWRRWAQAAGEKRLDNKTAFGRALGSPGLESCRDAGMRFRRGIALNDGARVEAEEAIKGWAS